jgi:hypothetical protein
MGLLYLSLHILGACLSVDLVIQHVMRMRRVILSSVACLAFPYFSAVSHERYDLRKNVLNTKVCLEFVYSFCLKHLEFVYSFYLKHLEFVYSFYLKHLEFVYSFCLKHFSF